MPRRACCANYPCAFSTSHETWTAWDLARRYDNHPIYDLVYVALAERRRTRLITADSRLRQTLVGLDWLVAPEQLLR